MPSALQPDDEIALSHPKRMIAQYAVNEEGRRELRLFYGAKEVSFDEQELFAFGEALARAGRFRAADATRWGDGYPWERLQPLLSALVDEQILLRVENIEAAPETSRARPAPLPPAPAAAYRSWREAEAITRDLAGRAVEPGYLECFVPVFRAAHAALDQDGRQVGEANVFPRALRLEAPTEWVACLYPGSRHQAAAPMNLTALKAMREHWPAMMGALLRIRAAFARRLPGGVFAATVGNVERLAVAALGLPSYQVLRWDRPEAPLPPALSSLFRVTDGLRMTMHQMLFVPIGEPTLAPDTPVDARMVHDYAERNHSFFSDTGVCAGPKLLVQEFLEVLIEGAHAAKYGAAPLPAEVEAALVDVEAAIDYALTGLQAYAVTYSLWPRMTRAYVEIDQILSAHRAPSLQAPAERFRAHAEALANSPYLAKEAWRADREQVYLDMHRACAAALGGGDEDLLEKAVGLSLPEDGEGARRVERVPFETNLRPSIVAAKAETQGPGHVAIPLGPRLRGDDTGEQSQERKALAPALPVGVLTVGAAGLFHNDNGAAPVDPARALALAVADALERRFGPDACLAPLALALADFVSLTHRLLAAAEATQRRINQILRRPAPSRPLDAFDLDVHNRLQGAEARRLPYLLDELRDVFGLDFRIDSAGVALNPASGGPA